MELGDSLGDWAPLVRGWAQSAAGQATAEALAARRAAGACIYPPDPLAALRLTACAATRVLILGQDPYHGPGQAEGLAFSVPVGIKPPPSLRNIHTELARDLGLAAPGHGSLRAWGGRGVLLLNTCLTVEDGAPASHAKLGWQSLTSLICQTLHRQGLPLVVMLWGGHAQAHWRAAVGDTRPGLWLLLANHPSPLSARRPPEPFIGCGHFGRANTLLQGVGGAAVDWRLPSSASVL